MVITTGHKATIAATVAIRLGQGSKRRRRLDLNQLLRATVEISLPASAGPSSPAPPLLRSVRPLTPISVMIRQTQRAFFRGLAAQANNGVETDGHDMLVVAG